jgi:NADH:ubiquinone reductase (non-electrogenic)
VTIRHNAIVKSVTNDFVVLTDRITEEDFNLPADLVIVTAGTEQTPFIRSLDLQKDAHGKIRTKKTLQSVDYDHIYALGDCAVVEGASYPATAQVAMQQSLTVAFNVVESIHHERRRNATSAPLRLHEFTFINLGEMLSLGTTAATMSSLGGYLNISGPLAALARRVVYALRMPTLEQTLVALCSAASTTGSKLFRRGPAL